MAWRGSRYSRCLVAEGYDGSPKKKKRVARRPPGVKPRRQSEDLRHSESNAGGSRSSGSGASGSEDSELAAIYDTPAGKAVGGGVDKV